jgi:hypothetical protein
VLCALTLGSVPPAQSVTLNPLLAGAAEVANDAAKLAVRRKSEDGKACDRAKDLDESLRKLAAAVPASSGAATALAGAQAQADYERTVQLAAQEATQSRRACDAAKVATAAAARIDGEAQQLLRTMAMLVPACSVDPTGPCAARLLEPDLRALRSRVVAAQADVPTPVDAAQVTTRAGAALSEVAKLKAEQEGAFKHGDTAASAALKWLEANKEASLDERARVASAAAASLGASLEVFATGREAQRAANDLVRAALNLAQCAPGAELCPGGRYRIDLESTAAAADARLAKLLSEGKDAAKRAKEQRWESEVRGMNDIAARQRAIRFLRLLDDNDDAKSLAGADAARITASTAGSQATLRLNFDAPSAWSRNRYNLAFSAPLNESDSRSSVFSRAADKLETRPHVRFTWNRLFQPADADWAFGAWGLTAAAGREEVSYVDTADLSAPKSQRTSPTSLGVTLLLSPARLGQLHDLRIERQRAVDKASSKITCPAATAGSTAPTTCLQGRVGVPTQSWSTVSSYEYRRQRTQLDFAVKVTYDRDQRLADVVVPFYLFKSGDDDDKGKRNAGISIAWGNKDRGTTIAVFVGAPFALRAK